MRSWYTSDLIITVREIHRAIESYEGTKWFWQSNHPDIDKLKKMTRALSQQKLTNETWALYNEQIWDLYNVLRTCPSDQTDAEAIKAITQIKQSFPFFNTLLRFRQSALLKEHFLTILTHAERGPILAALEMLQEGELLDNEVIFAFTIDQSYLVKKIMIEFQAGKIDTELFLQIIKLHSHMRFLSHEDIGTIIAHPDPKALLQALEVFYAVGSLPQDRDILGTLLSQDETESTPTIPIILRILDEYEMDVKPMVDLCGMTSCKQRGNLLYAIQSIHEKISAPDKAYFQQVGQSLMALLNANLFTEENIDRTVEYAKNANMATALHLLGKLALSFKVFGSKTEVPDLQEYFNAIVAHPFPEKIAYCLSNWRDRRSVEGLTACLTITEPNLIRLLTVFVDASALNDGVLNGLIQLGRVYEEQDLQEITDAFALLPLFWISKNIWTDGGKSFIELCAMAHTQPEKAKSGLIDYTLSIKQQFLLKVKNDVDNYYRFTSPRKTAKQSPAPEKHYSIHTP